MIHETMHDEMERERRYNYPGGAAMVTITLEEYRDLIRSKAKMEALAWAASRIDGDEDPEQDESAPVEKPAAPRARVLSLAEADDAPLVWLHSQSGYTEPARVEIMPNGIRLQRFGKKDFMLSRSEWGRDIVAFDVCPSDEDVAAIQWLRPGQEAQDD